MIKLLVCLSTAMSVLFQIASTTSCAVSDYQTVIGGEGFQVLKIRTAVNLHGDILVGGTVKCELDEDVPKVFLYMLRISTCELMWKTEFDEFTSGMDSVEWSYDGKYAYLVGHT